MTDFSPIAPFERLKKAATAAVKGHFPIKGKTHTIKATDVWVDDTKSIDDIRSQKEAKLKGRSWTVPIRGNIQIVDNRTGKVVDERETTIAQLPKVTRRYSYIVDGSEWQVNNQFRLKSGVYTRRKENGELESHWNLEKGLAGTDIKMKLDPETKKMMLSHGSTNVSLYPVLKTLGMDDDSIERAWGKELLNANRKTDRANETDLRKLHRKVVGKPAASMDEVRSHLREAFAETKLRPDSTEVTLGKPYTTVDATSLLASSSKLLRVSRQEEPPDDRDSLMFKDFLGAEDMVEERISKDFRRDIQRKLLNRLDKVTKPKVQSVISPDIFGKPIKGLFSNSAISDRPTQLNPMSNIGGHRRTTLGGEHGIQGDNQITLEMQSINPSHLGFLDPIRTPEQARIGTILQMATSTKKDGKEIKTRAWNTKTGRLEWVNPMTARQANVAFPDQYDWVGGKPKPRSREIKILDSEGEMTTSLPAKVDYILRSTKGLFDVSANTIPFLQNNQGNRTMVAAKQLEQSVPLVAREIPLVQTKGEGNLTFERALGGFNSHASPVDGTVDRITNDSIIIKDAQGKRYEVQLYEDFPLNDNKSVMSSTPIVKKGDQVKMDQVIADTNFTKDGTLALGVNLDVAYMPYKGYNFEDGIVISESGAKKLTSEHMLRQNVRVESNVILKKDQYMANTAGQVTQDQADKLDEYGVIKEGEIVNPGDIVIAKLKEVQLTPEQQALQKFSKKLFTNVQADPQIWTNDYPGKVSRVVRHGKETTVYIKAQTPAQIGDKIVGRHGNKGIITKILPDHEMPRKKTGEHAEVLLNPTGVPTRINLGQVLETAATRIAEKTGKPYIVNNFDPNNRDYTRNLIAELRKAGLSEGDIFYDPQTGKPVSSKPILNGKQYILKLEHTAEKGISARFRGPYDLNLSPKKGGPESGQSMDTHGLYALLAHGARENIREMQTVKSDKNDDYWTAVQTGNTPPAPAVPFAYKKFESYLRGMGIDIKKNGNRVHLGPLTDKQTLALSNGEIKRPDLALKHTSKSELVPEKGSTFDPEVTGTTNLVNGLGTKWGHISLALRMPNPTFEKPVKALLGISTPQFNKIINGQETLEGRTGPAAIVSALKEIDVEKELADARAKLQKLDGPRLNQAARKARYLRALSDQKMKADEAYTMKYLPVIPPNMRPPAVLDDGSLRTDDISGIYHQLGQVNQQTKAIRGDVRRGILEEDEDVVKELDGSLYDGLRALTMTGLTHRTRHWRGIAELIGGGKGRSPKEAYFQNRVIGKRQDLSMRGVIVPEPSLGVDEVQLPQKAAQEIYKPFIVRRMVQQGFTPGKAVDAIRRNDPLALRALEVEMESRPVFLKRDPVLHKYGVQAFKPQITKGKAIKIHPLATSGYNADFDGDKMAAFVPVSGAAVKEAYNMLPSRNLFSPSTGQLMLVPSQESMLGLYELSKFGKETKHRFRTPADAARAVLQGKLDPTDVIIIDEPKKPIPSHLDPLSAGKMKKAASTAVKTTVGRILLAQALPDKMQVSGLLTDKKFRLTKSQLKDLLNKTGKEFQPQDFAKTADRLKDLGNDYSTGFSFGLSDLLSQRVARDRILTATRQEERKIRSTTRDPDKRKQKLVRLHAKANDLVSRAAKAEAERLDNRMYRWVKSGARGGWDQYQQMTVAPIQVVDPKGDPLPYLIGKSYSEGLDSADYWASMYGARMGTIGRVKETREPGAMTKEMMQTSMNQLVTEDDCGTTRGLNMGVGDSNALNRVLAEDVKLGTRAGKDKGIIPKGTILTPGLVNRLKNNKVRDVTVRSPLRCETSDGLCSTCFGLNEAGHLPSKGTNLGVIAAHALGEPLTQMAMNCNAAGNLVTVRAEGEVDTVTFEQLWQRIDSFVDTDGDVETKAVCDLEVWDHDRFVEVFTIQRHKPTDEMVLVRLESGHTFLVQSDHPNWARLEVPACKFCQNEEPVIFVGHYKDKSKTSVRCSSCRQPFQVSPGTYERQQERVVLSRDLEDTYLGVSPHQTNTESTINIDTYLLGVILAEGNVRRIRADQWPEEGRKRRRVSPFGMRWKVLGLSITQNDGDVKEMIKERLSCSGLEYTEPSERVLQVNDVDFARSAWMVLGIGSHKKTLPPGWLGLSDSDKKGLLAGLIDGDGTETPKGGLLYTTSWSLASQTQELVRSLGGRATSGRCTERENERHPCFYVRMTLPFKLPSVKDISGWQGGSKLTGYSKVVAVQSIPYDDWTYDLSTFSRAFSANGIRTHNSFHTGGIAGSIGAQASDKFDRVKQLLQFPKTLPGSATLATVGGEVERVQKDRVTGGYNVFIGGERHFVPVDRGIPSVKQGVTVKKGEALSIGPKNPLEMIKLTGVSSVQKYLTNELENIYGGDRQGSNIHRRNAETFVRSLTNLSVVKDPGDNPELMRGDKMPTTALSAWNSGNEGKRQVRFEPLLKGTNVLPNEIQTDWMARLQFQDLKRTITDAAAEGWYSDVHGTHPVPAMAYGKEFGKGVPAAPWKY